MVTRKNGSGGKVGQALATPATASQQPLHGIYREPAFVCVYGDTGAGKSSSCLLSFPTAFYVTPRGVEKVARRVAGLPIESGLPVTDEGRYQTLNTLLAIDARTGQTPLQMIAAAGYPAIVIDDATIIGERTSAMLDAVYAKTRDGVYQRWAVYGNLWMGVRDALRMSTLHGILNFHTMSPWMDKNEDMTAVRRKGGPAMQGKTAPIRFPPACDLVLRAVVDPTWWESDWRGVFECDPEHPDYYTKDRHDCLPKRSPMNLGEILRFCGYRIDRAPGLEWQEGVVEAGAQALVQGGFSQLAAAEAWAIEACKRFLGGQPVERAFAAIRWTVRDLRARAFFRTIRTERLARYGLPASGLVPAQPK